MYKLIIANWKMNPSSPKEAVSLAKKINSGISKSGNAEVVICPPLIYLHSLSSVIGHRSSVKLGAQDDFLENQGTYTGGVSPSMLKNSRVEYVIIGHSERRRLGETDEMINKKVIASLKAGLKVILCVGEPKRESGIMNNELGKSKSYVKNQLRKEIKGIAHYSKFIIHNSLIIAYEPVWAISTNKNSRPDKPEDALEMIKYIKSFLSTKPYTLNPKVLYGGSVNSQNARNFLQYKEIDGALVGGASLKPVEFIKIVKSA